MRRMLPIGALAVCLVAARAAVPAAAEEKKPGWSDSAEFAYVVTAGNAETSTLGMKNTLKRTWANANLTFSAGAIRAQADVVVARYALGSEADFDVTTEKETRTTAETYYLNGRYDRQISARLYWYGSAGWDRNRPAGIENRYIGAAGVGNIWFETDRAKFRTDYAVTWTKQDDVVVVGGKKDQFLGLRASWDYLRRLGPATTYTDRLILDANLDDGQDWRGDWTNSLAVAMNRHLALKVSLQWLYDHQPSLRAVDLLDARPPAGVRIGTVYEDLDSLDRIFTASLVVSF